MSESRRIAVARRLQASTVTVVAGPSSGSGFVIGHERWIITNAHVVAPGGGRGGRVQVRFGSGTTLNATILDIDPSHDLAILEVQGRVPSPPLPLTDSDRVEVGQTVLAFGSPFGLDGTLTQGIVSARRDVPGIGGGMARRLIQTDAPINPGNSGGPLVDHRGRVIGVNTAILSRTGGSHGIGFAVPANYVEEVLDRVRESRRAPNGQQQEATSTTVASAASSSPPILPAPPQPELGIVGDDWNEGGYIGVRIQRTTPGSAAHRAGLLGAAEPPPPLVARLRVTWTGHIITAVDGVPVRSMDELRTAIASRRPGDQVRLTVTVGPGVLHGDTTVTLPSP
jgi:S1-C subfamily serine protease